MSHLKRYRIQKFVYANSAQEAIEKALHIPVQDVFVDELTNPAPSADAIGFKTVEYED